MTDLFGKGGNKEVQVTDTEPSPLDLNGDKSEIKNKIQNPLPGKQIGPSSNDIETQDNDESVFSVSKVRAQNNVAGPDSYKTTGAFSKDKTDSVKDYADMQITDGLKDEDIASLRKEGYKLSNLEKEFGIRHSNDFNNIIKNILIVFSSVVGVAFAFIIGIIVWTSYKTNTITETGIISNFLQFIVEIVKVGLST